MSRRSKKTTMAYNHNHGYIVDANGNGKTERACHPLNPTICHSHEIRNFVVQHQASECYPDCTGQGAPGAPLHGHRIEVPNDAVNEIHGRARRRSFTNNTSINRNISGIVKRTPSNYNLIRNNELPPEINPQTYQVPSRIRGRLSPRIQTSNNNFINTDLVDPNETSENNIPGANVFNSEMNRAKRALDGEMAGPESSGNTGGSGGNTGGSGGSGGNTGGSGGGSYGGGY
tara:strand:- start:213 stop:902 length:690 start_codon:yes stop_codon:yes gene_type:complete